METDPTDVKKKLEDIAGRELSVAHEQLIKLRFPVSAFDSTEGAVAWQHIFLPGMSCENARLLDVSGASISGADGKRVIRLSDVVCLGEQRRLAEPVNLLATARSVKPFFVTNTHSLINPSDPMLSDIEMTFFIWDANGAEAPNVVFDWRCRAITPPVVL
jgi:hypothetical protein